ncbi:MotA/TolQ/ExbB proton channel family protein, partial [Nitrospinae bacterium AH_259_B05_G02_I21]|nr:MotA/TolQ/ExbB proton channel family protein [Nitrospinae bacterium AH_259_B05_G02_I21]
MIKIFGVISEQPIVSPPSLAGGISEALYTTAFGLSVAIPAFIAYKYTSGKAEEIAAELEEEGMN